MQFIKAIFSIALLSSSVLCANAQEDITIDLKSHGDKVYPTMYGAFFEEISHAGDGGLYAEMIQNRGFEEVTIPSGCTLENGEVWAPKKPCYTTDKINNWHIRWNVEKKAMQGWDVYTGEHSSYEYTLKTENPLNNATPFYLHIHLNDDNSGVTVANKGYWGIAVKEGEKYNLRYYTRGDNTCRLVSVRLFSKTQGIVAEQTEEHTLEGRWKETRTTLQAKATANDCELQLCFAGRGEINLDYVSLFPENTYNHRENGLRADIAQYLVDLHPSFLRWPGGCILEGINMDNAVDWKKTLGDPVTRPGEYDLWGYRNSYGFGYHEFLQFCEDAGIDPMYVCNAGMSCLFRGGDYVEGDSLEAMIEDCLNAIEYAVGDVTTYWGHQRALNGHPKPFPLRYVEVGNENVGPRYAEHFKQFRDAIREVYPQIEIICALMFHPEIPDCGDMDLFDPHYYENADWFYRAADIFDSIPEKYKSNIYIGEYAAGGANMYAALAEAAFLTGCERNGERIRMVSFAPLFQNIHNGTRHLICFDNNKVFGRSNYHMVKAMNENRPDYNLTTKVQSVPLIHRDNLMEGKIGLSTYGNDVEFRDFRLINDGKEELTFTSDNPATDTENWTTETDGNNRFYWFKEKGDMSYEISFRMKKNTGKEACRVMFRGKDTKNFYMAELGSHQNESTIFGERKNGDYTNYFTYRNVEKIEQGKWYDVKVKVDMYHWQIYLDGRLVEDYVHDWDLTRHYAVSGLDEKNGEVIVKLVNGNNEEWTPTLQFLGGKVKSEAKRITISANSPTDENSIDSPEKIVPVTDTIVLNEKTKELTLPANSFTILRFKKK